jgi:hypothetical protein
VDLPHPALGQDFTPVSSRKLLAVLPLHVIHDVAAVFAAVEADRYEAGLRGHEAGALLHELENFRLIVRGQLDRGDLGHDVAVFADFRHGQSPAVPEITPNLRARFRTDSVLVVIVRESGRPSNHRR